MKSPSLFLGCFSHPLRLHLVSSISCGKTWQSVCCQQQGPWQRPNPPRQRLPSRRPPLCTSDGGSRHQHSRRCTRKGPYKVISRGDKVFYLDVVRGEATGQRVPGFYSRQQHLLYLAFEWGGGGVGGASWRAGTRGESQARRASTKYFDVGVGEGGEGAYLTLFPVRKGHIGVFTPSFRTRDYLPVNNSLGHKTQILFL